MVHFNTSAIIRLLQVHQNKNEPLGIQKICQTIAALGRTRTNTSTLTPPMAFKADTRADTLASRCLPRPFPESGTTAVVAVGVDVTCGADATGWGVAGTAASG